MIRFECPTCQKVLKTSDNKAGRKILCPRCGQHLVIPPPYNIQNKAILGKSLPLDSPASASALVPSVNSLAPEPASALLPSWRTNQPPVRVSLPASSDSPVSETVRPEQLPPDSLAASTPELSSAPLPNWMINQPPVRTSLPASSVSPNAETVLEGQLLQATFSEFTVEGDESSSDDVEGSDETDFVPARKHSVPGIWSTGGAVVMFVLFLVFIQIHKDKTERPGLTNDEKDKISSIRGLCCFVALSYAVTSLAFAGLSLGSNAKKHWSITGCVFNASLLICILVWMKMH